MVTRVITIGTAETPPGATAFGALKVAELNDSSPVEVPVAIVNGRQEGPILWIQNAVHGDEYVSLGAIQRLLRELDPRALRGAVVAIPVANILAYRARQRSAPQDGADMNRIWPGNPVAEAVQLQAHTEVVAFHLFQGIQEYADYVVDCHDGSSQASMSPYAAYYTGSQDWEQRSRDLAVASGMSIVWKTVSDFVGEKFPHSIKVEAARVNIPTVTLEMGGQGRLDEGDVARMHLALRNTLAHLQMVDAQVRTPQEQIHISKGNWLRPSVGGVFWPQVKPLERVAEGQTVAVITDLFGREKERLRAPRDGVVVGIRTTGTTASGEYAGNIGEPDLE